MSPTMTQLLFGIQGVLMTIQGGLILYTDLGIAPIILATVNLACSAAIALIGPFIPKVSEIARRTLGLQRRG